MAASPAEDAALAPDVRLSLFHGMLRLRLIEEAIVDHYSEEKMRCPVHLSVGQEAAAVGTAAALRSTDRIVSTHRGHAHYLAKGGSLDAMVAEMYGKATGCSGGRGGSMNLIDLEAGVVLTLPIVASSVPLGVGLALADRQNGTDGVTGVYFGDAVVEEGVFHESANFAALKALPTVFVLENNLYSVYTPLAERQPLRPFTEIAAAHGIPFATGNGNDVEEVFTLTAKAVDHARSGAGPFFLCFDTYRWREHCGPNYDNHIGYRTEEEFQDWRTRCPLEACRNRLTDAGLLDAGMEAVMTQEIEAEIEAAFAAAEAAPFPDPAQAGTKVYG